MLPRMQKTMARMSVREEESSGYSSACRQGASCCARKEEQRRRTIDDDAPVALAVGRYAVDVAQVALREQARDVLRARAWSNGSA